jgi:hypothetical protein
MTRGGAYLSLGMKLGFYRIRFIDEKRDAIKRLPVGDHPRQLLIMVDLGVELDAPFTHSRRPTKLSPTSQCSGSQRPRRPSTRLRLLPTFLTAFFTAALDRRVFFASYLTS